MKVLIAVPTYETITPDTFKSIYDMYKGKHEVDFAFVRGYDVATARNRIVQKSLDGGYSHVLMIDNDVTPPRDALLNLLAHDKDVVLGFYAHRDVDNLYKGRTNICKLRDENGVKYFNFPLESEYTEDEMREMRESGQYLVKIHGGGMGCALIKTEVFSNIKYPWYDWVNYADDNRGMLSEDLYFCEQCKWSAIPIYTDTRVGCGHLLRHIQNVM